ncbi:MAG: protein kinase, partial [Planctomycetota bacterium]
MSIMKTSKCPGVDRLSKFLSGELSPDECESIIEHVDQCEICQSIIEGIEPNEIGVVASPIEEQTSFSSSLQNAHEFAPDEAAEQAIVEALIKREPILQEEQPKIPHRIGPHVVTGLLARGGMGTVYRGRHVNLGRSVAIKWLGERFDEDDPIASRQRAEAVLNEWRAHGRLNHPNVVTATDAGLIDGHPYLVMELIEGIDLASLVKSHGPLSIEIALAIVLEIAEALAYTHDSGVGHADIKPSNVMLSVDGVVKVLDLGTAALDEDLKGIQGVFGTLAFMAPEKIKAAIVRATGTGSDGKRKHGVFTDRRAIIAADIYSLGCTLQYLITGSSPWCDHSDQAANLERLQAEVKRRSTPPPRLTSASSRNEDANLGRLADETQALTDWMLSPEPAARPASMQEIAQHIRDNFSSTKLSHATELKRLAVENYEPSASSESTGHTVGLTQLIEKSEIHHGYRGRYFVLTLFIAGLIALGIFIGVRNNEPQNNLAKR